MLFVLLRSLFFRNTYLRVESYSIQLRGYSSVSLLLLLKPEGGFGKKQ